SPAVGAGSTSLSCSVGWCDPNGSSPSSIYGSTDFLGNPRTNGSSIDIGAYQNTGNAISNSMTVNLTSGASTLQYGQGQSTTLTVTVTALPGVGGAPSGTVNLMLGPTLLETATLLPTGPNSTAATMPLSASQLAAGANTLTAVYSGNSIAPCCSPSEPPGGSQTPIPWYSSATSAPITVTETPATTSIAVTSVSPASEDYGLDTPVTITAVLSWTGNGVAPTASDVTIGGNGPSGTYVTTGCSAPSGTTMTCTGTYTPTVADTAGSYTETATFAGDSNYSGSSSAQTNNFTINQASATTVVTTSGSPSIYGQSVTFTATINGENGLVKGRNGRAKPQDVSGSVTWSANTGCGTTPVTTGNPGTATCTTSILNAGSDTITATYSGDSNHGGSTATLSGGQTVNQASQTITVSVPAPPTATNGSSFTVVATGGGSGNPVVFTSFGACSNLRGTYTMNLGKACTVTMNQAGNANYTAAPTVTETTTEAAAIAPTVSVTVPASAPYQSTFTPVATTNASTTPTITVAPATVCTISGGVVTMENGTGTCSVTAKWAADDVYKAANATAKTTASKLASVVTWATPDPITYGTALSATQLDATASVPGMFVYTPASGKVLAVGTQTLSVKFTPTQSTDYTTVTGTTVPLVVNPANTTTTITTTSVNPSIIGHAVTVYYAVASPGKVTGSVAVTASSGETCGGPVAEATGLGSCRLTLQTVGSITLTATYGGDANNNGSVSAGFTQTVN
ncbi:MAG: Ig-like domain repeat protein, partial [Terriglobales bacterium]